MKIIFTIITFLLTNILCIFSMPKDAIYVWYKPKQDSLINGNPVERQHYIADTIGIYSEKFCFFSVHDAMQGEKERPVWRMRKLSGKEMVCTTDRVADLDDIKYMNYSRKSCHPRIYTYKYHAPKDSTKNVKCVLVGGRLQKNIPVDTALGMQGEYIITNRILNPKEMNIVESYLSIKYGISLEKWSSYYSANGKLIWNAKKNSSHNENVFGIGCDSISGLSQKKSVNVAEPLFVVSSKEIKEGEYVLFGDNGGCLEYEQKDNQNVLNREWLVRYTGTSDSVNCNLEFSIHPQYSSILKILHPDGTESYVDPEYGQVFNDVLLKDGDKITLVSKDNMEYEKPFITISAYPNPIKLEGECILTINTESSTKYELRMYDEDGKLLWGKNGFTEGLEQVLIPMNTHGIVVVEAKARGVNAYTKIIVE
ncbi:MAG: hypothetical protein IK017_05375 [Paludibacteraceae bacterium]|nr:hypothetical protein [Paludibacteraceae bacterium]